MDIQKIGLWAGVTAAILGIIKYYWEFFKLVYGWVTKTLRHKTIDPRAPKKCPNNCGTRLKVDAAKRDFWRWHCPKCQRFFTYKIP